MQINEDRFVIVIKNDSKKEMQYPLIEGQIKVDWSRQGAPGKMTFNVVKNDDIDYQEGNAVGLYVDGEIFFYGYIFEKSRNGDQIIKTTCYDQLRYLKNKTTFQYKNWTYSELLTNICRDRLLQTGEIENTKKKIGERIEEDKEFFEMLQYANDFTTHHTGEIYVLFDDCGKITLKNRRNMRVKDVISYHNTQDFDYKTSIDKNTYNRIYLRKLDDNNQEVGHAVAEDEKSMAEWGILSYSDMTNSNDVDLKAKAKEMLKILNRKERTLKIKDVIGSVYVRAGSMIKVEFPEIGDINIDSYMMVNSITHTFEGEQHTMSLDVVNKDIMLNPTVPKLPQEQKQSTKENKEGSSKNVGKGTQGAMEYAKKAVGSKYSQPKRFAPGHYDCSSLVMRSFQDVGLLPKKGYNLTTYTMPTDKHFMEINKNQLQYGDILWKQEHVAFYMGGNKTLEAKGKAYGVVYDKMDNRFNRYFRIRGG